MHKRPDFVIAIEPGDADHAFGVVVPDLPGCFSAGDTLEEAIKNAAEAIDGWIETLLDNGGVVPAAKPISEHQRKPEFAGWIWMVVSVEQAR